MDQRDRNAGSVVRASEDPFADVARGNVTGESLLLEQIAGAILEVIQKGYRLGDRILRPARVVVSAGGDGD